MVPWKSWVASTLARHGIAIVRGGEPPIRILRCCRLVPIVARGQARNVMSRHDENVVGVTRRISTRCLVLLLLPGCLVDDLSLGRVNSVVSIARPPRRMTASRQPCVQRVDQAIIQETHLYADVGSEA